VAWTQFSIGTSKSFLWDTTTSLPHTVESKWLQSFRSYLQHAGARIELDKDYVPPIERVHDSHIMDLIVSSNQFTEPKIRQLNYCRLYLQALTISDITKANGRFLDTDMLHGVIQKHSSSSRWHHVTQEKPHARSWQLWKTANRIWSNDQDELHQPLQRWRQRTQQQRRA
jgi:hypothetical protein